MEDVAVAAILEELLRLLHGLVNEVVAVGELTGSNLGTVVTVDAGAIVASA